MNEMTIEVKEKSGTYVFYSFVVRDVKVWWIYYEFGVELWRIILADC
jgi:hypothetical protein